MSTHVCKCMYNGREEFHIRYPGMTEREALNLNDAINSGAYQRPVAPSKEVLADTDMAYTEPKIEIDPLLETALAALKTAEAALTDSRRANAMLREALDKAFGYTEVGINRGPAVFGWQDMRRNVERALAATSADHKAWEDSLFGEALQWTATTERGMMITRRHREDVIEYACKIGEVINEPVALFAKNKPKGGA